MEEEEGAAAKRPKEAGDTDTAAAVPPAREPPGLTTMLTEAELKGRPTRARKPPSDPVKEAAAKLAARRARQDRGEDASREDANIAVCEGIAKKLHGSGDSQSTTGVGIHKNKLYVYSQNRVIDEEKARALAKAHGLEFGAVIPRTAESTGKHAETVIVRYLLDQGESVDSLEGALTVGASQGCCADCAGFLNDHQIAHGDLRVGDPYSDYWWDPLTNEKFAGGRTG